MSFFHFYYSSVVIILKVTNTSISRNPDEFKIVGIKDSNTFVVLIDGKEQVIRLEHIDFSEKSNHLEIRQNNLLLTCALARMFSYQTSAKTFSLFNKTKSPAE